MKPAKRLYRGIRNAAYITTSIGLGLSCGWVQGRLSNASVPSHRSKLMSRYRTLRSALKRVMTASGGVRPDEAEAMLEQMGFAASGERIEHTVH